MDSGSREDRNAIALLTSDDFVNNQECPQETYYGHSSWIFTIIRLPHSNLIVSGSGDSRIRLWDPSTSSSLFTLNAHTDAVYTMLESSPGGAAQWGRRFQNERMESNDWRDHQVVCTRSRFI